MDTDSQIVILKKKCNDMIKHICDLLKDNPKYVFSKACSDNLDLYFKWINYVTLLEGRDL